MKLAVFALLLFLAAPSEEINFTATSVNVAEPGAPVKIRILRWSTDQERTPLVTALNPPAAPAAPARNSNAPESGRGRGARGRGRAGGAAAPLTPIAAFTAALGRAPTIGYIWTNDITGYAIKYAWHSPQPDGTDHVVIASDRRLGAYTNAWKMQAAETDYSFTLIELRVGPKGVVEGKTSLTNKIAVDVDAKTVRIENYPAAAASLAPTSTAGTAPRPSR